MINIRKLISLLFASAFFLSFSTQSFAIDKLHFIIGGGAGGGAGGIEGGGVGTGGREGGGTFCSETIAQNRLGEYQRTNSGCWSRVETRARGGF